MLLRSSNEQVAIFNSASGLLYASVVYDGPPVSGALLIGAAHCVRLSALTATGIEFGLRVPRLVATPALVNNFSGSITVGERVVCSLVATFDLVRGDVIECWLDSTQSNRWALEAQGFSVTIR